MVGLFIQIESSNFSSTEGKVLQQDIVSGNVIFYSDDLDVCVRVYMFLYNCTQAYRVLLHMLVWFLNVILVIKCHPITLMAMHMLSLTNPNNLYYLYEKTLHFHSFLWFNYFPSGTLSLCVFLVNGGLTFSIFCFNKYFKSIGAYRSWLWIDGRRQPTNSIWTCVYHEPPPRQVGYMSSFSRLAFICPLLLSLGKL